LRTTPHAELDKIGYVNQHGLSRKVDALVSFPVSCFVTLALQHIFDSVKKSLERLQLEYIDVLQCHRFDPDTPIEETMQALHDVVKAGYVRYIGMSSCYAWQCAYAFKLSQQPVYSSWLQFTSCRVSN
jgi:aryl-alcohol dehydrogenase-like predicted oxidoreductase